MYIKQVIIAGFKSYLEQTTTEPFRQGINVVVGANGSGKSNFFHAIRFVLNDLSSTLRLEDREKLLHEGAGNAVSSAYVELVLDNSDGRLPVDKTEVRLRRSIGLKKDEYQLNKKLITKAEAMNLLETAGFSCANPYYVVQQGKITAMANMKDTERLGLLKEIGGTRVYEERRRDSLKLMRECESKRATIDALVSQLDTKLRELDEERSELAAFQAADRTRRSLDYALLQLEMADVRDAQAALSEETAEHAERAGTARDSVRDAETRAGAVSATLRALSTRRRELEARRSESAAERVSLLQRQAALELDVQDLERGISGASDSRKRAREELLRVRAAVEARRKELATLESALSTAETKESTAEAGLAAREARRQALVAKKGRGGQFATAAERDAALNAEISAMEGAVLTKHETAAAALREAAAAEAEAKVLETEEQALAGRLAASEASLAAIASSVAGASQQRDEHANRQKNLWRAEADCEASRRAASDELAQQKRLLEGAVARDILRGVEAVEKLTKECDVQGVHGPLVDLVVVPGAFTTAAEVVAGNSLFYIVVDDDAAATKLTSLLTQRRQGRATFMPLNRLEVPTASYPTNYGTDVIPLVSQLQYDAKHEAAVRQVFGKTLVCRTLELATRVARETGLNCVTLDGDQVEKRGALRGGFLDMHRSRMRICSGARGLRKEFGERESELETVRAQLLETQQAVVLAAADVSARQAEQEHTRAQLSSERSALRTLRDRLEAARKNAQTAHQAASDVRATCAALEESVTALRAELGRPLVERLGAKEANELKRLPEEISNLKAAATEARERRRELAAQVEALRDGLAGVLRKQQEDLEERAGEGGDVDEPALDARRAELDMVANGLGDLQALESRFDADLEQTDVELQKARADDEDIRTMLAQANQAMEDAVRDEESLHTRRAMLGLRLADLERRVRELGVLPADAFEAHRGLEPNAIRAQLRKVNAELKKYQHVNRKALDRYVSFAEQRDELVRRKQENDQGEEKIRQLISTLDMRKDEALERTFKGVAKNFREIFALLVPGGRGEVVMQKRTPGTETDENVDPLGGTKPAAQPSMDRYAGVKVKVSFGPGGETLSLRQLSGGQKTLVALTLIFAIQRCDPAPFYLFDEIDAALDPQYRTMVAEMLRIQASDPRNPSQFIVTTFHPQIVMVADKVYGISHSNRISRVEVIGHEDAAAFLQAEEGAASPPTHQRRLQDDEDRRSQHSLVA